MELIDSLHEEAKEKSDAQSLISENSSGEMDAEKDEHIDSDECNEENEAEQ